MNRIKAWLRVWLGVVSEQELANARSEDKQQLSDRYLSDMIDLNSEHQTTFAELKKRMVDLNAECVKSFSAVEGNAIDTRSALDNLRAEHDAAIAQLIMDINGIRNQIPAATAQATNSKVRVIRNFGEFKAAIEVTPQRKSQ